MIPNRKRREQIERELEECWRDLRRERKRLGLPPSAVSPPAKSAPPALPPRPVDIPQEPRERHYWRIGERARLRARVKVDAGDKGLESGAVVEVLRLVGRRAHVFDPNEPLRGPWPLVPGKSGWSVGLVKLLYFPEDN